MDKITTKQTYDRDKASKAQKEYCDRTSSPHFAPLGGRCWSCCNNIYDRIEHTMSNGEKYYTGITVENAGEYLITGCPHCHRSYCD